MRIIGGSLRSRRFEAPPGMATRPTSDRLRETLFNVLAPRIEGAAFLDLYAGSGAVGMEALSRGAARVVFVERAVGALKVLRENLARLGLKDGVEVRAEGVGALLKRSAGDRFDIVFLDPPYNAEGEYETVLGYLGNIGCVPRSPNERDLHSSDEDLSLGTPDLGHPILSEGALVVAEHRRKDALKVRYGSLERTRLLQQGDAALSFYSMGS